MNDGSGGGGAADSRAGRPQVGGLEGRTRALALSVIRLYGSLPNTAVAQVLGRQVLRSGTSPGAHHREARRARSVAEFISKMEVAAQELDETEYWLELLRDAGVISDAQATALCVEVDELIAIVVASVKTAKRRQRGA
jgi:four helix bundle protein